MKKDLKSMIKKLSDEQEIHDIQNDILKNVDMNKVRNQSFVKNPHPKRFILLTNMFSAFAAAMIVVLVVLIINSNNKPEENKPIDSPIVDNNTSGDNNTTLPETKFEDNLLMFSQYLESMQKQEAYNMINVVPSFGKFTFNEVTLSDDKSLTESEMVALANDLNSQIYNIEEMLGLTSIDCILNENQYYGVDESNYKDYENVISVTGPLSSYHLYFNEIDVTSKNIGKTNFKSKSNIYGVIDSETSIVSFEGQREYKNEKTTYLTKVELNGITIYVEEVFGENENEFLYTFYKDNLVKNIYIRQRFYADGNMKLDFKVIHTRNINDEDDLSKSTSIEVQTKNIENNNSIEFKFDSRSGETLTVTKNETNYTYKFGNGKEIVYNI